MILEYIALYAPVLVALLSEVGIIKFAIKTLGDAKETKEFKRLAAQNKILLEELREANKLNKELLTKIDKIQRGE